MTNLEITVLDTETGMSEKHNTNGYLLLYLENDKIKMSGRMDLKTLAPILTRIALEKIGQKIN